MYIIPSLIIRTHYLIEVEGGNIHPLAGSTVAGQYAIIADLERSLAYSKRALEDLTKSGSSNNGTADAIDGQSSPTSTANYISTSHNSTTTNVNNKQPLDSNMSPTTAVTAHLESEYLATIASLEADLSESKSLLESYYDKLQKGSQYVRTRETEFQQLQVLYDQKIQELEQLQKGHNSDSSSSPTAPTPSDPSTAHNTNNKLAPSTWELEAVEEYESRIEALEEELGKALGQCTELNNRAQAVEFTHQQEITRLLDQV